MSKAAIHSRSEVGLFAAGVALAAVACLGGLANLVVRWESQPEYSHGFFIPLVALWLLWQRRDALRASLGAPSWLGPALLLLASAMLVLGEVAAIFILVQYGFIVAMMGLVLCLGGLPLARVCALPLAVLLLAVPLPYFVDAQLSWRLQLLSSALGVDVLRLLGVSVFLEGNMIDLGSYRLQVVDACSGLRYLYPLLGIGFLMAYFYRDANWKKASLFLATVPITVLMNSLRIAAVGVLVSVWGPGMADGFLHYFEGWAVFIACLLLLVGGVWLFERFGRRRRVLDAMALPDVGGGGAVPGRPAWPRHPLVAGLALLLAVGAMLQVVGEREEIHPERQPLIAFPMRLGDWKATEDRLDSAVESALGVDDYLLADYRRAGGEGSLNFYVAYYASQRKGVSPHSPEVCIPGGGWLITSLRRVPVPLADGEEIVVNRSVIERAGQRQLVYYWFEERGRRIASEYLMKWYLLTDALIMRRSDGALVRLTTAVGDNETPEDADGRLAEFVRLAEPRLAAHVPH